MASGARPVHTAIRPPRKRTPLHLRHVWEYRELLYFFAWRDIKVRYKQSVLGAGWAVIQPLALMAAFTLFFGELAKIPSDGIPRPIFYYSALLPWTYFSQAASQSTNSIVSNAGLLSKVYFPRVLLPIAPIVSGLVDFFIAFAVLGGMFAYYVVQGTTELVLGPRVMLIPAFMMLAVATALGTGLWLSTLNARYRDVRYIITFILQFWMFASPIAYPTSLIPERWRPLYGLNPMAGAIEGFRWSLTGRGEAPGAMLGVSACAVVVLLVGGLLYFQRSEGNVADVV